MPTNAEDLTDAEALVRVVIIVVIEVTVEAPPAPPAPSEAPAHFDVTTTNCDEYWRFWAFA